MGIIEIVILIILLSFMIIGWKKGIIKEAVSLIGIILVLIISFMFKEQLGNVFCKWLPFFNYAGTPIEGMISLNVLVYQLLGFFIIFNLAYAVYMLILRLSGIFQKIVNFTIILLIPSKIGGAIIGLIQGYIIVFIGLILLTLPITENNIFVNNNTVTKILYNTPILSTYTKDLTGSLKDTYNLIDKLTSEQLTANQANLETIDIMLKYKLVTPKTIEQLIILDKLQNIDGIQQVVNKYK